MASWMMMIVATACAALPAAAQPLRIVGRHDVIEVGPVLHAVEAAGPAHAVFSSGGVDNLFKRDGVMAGAGGEFDHAVGRADIAAQAETQALRASVANPDLRIVLTIAEGIYSVVARRSAGIAGSADLRGKRIGVFERTSAAYFLHRMLDRAGLSEADVVIVPLRPREMTPALVAGQVDAVAIWEPESERSRIALGADAVSFGDPSAYRELYNLNTSAAALADPARRARIVDFVRTLLASIQTARDAPEQIWPLVTASSGHDSELVAAAWPHHRFPGVIPADMPDILDREERWLAIQAKRAARSRDDLARLIDRTVFEEASQPRDQASPNLSVSEAPPAWRGPSPKRR